MKNQIKDERQQQIKNAKKDGGLKRGEWWFKVRKKERKKEVAEKEENDG